jgi:hypothetical protein
MRYLRIIGWPCYLRREQLQLLLLTLFVEDFNRLQPAGLRRTVQFAQITECPLTRTIRRTYGFYQRPVTVLLAVFRSPVRAQKHSCPILS